LIKETKKDSLESLPIINSIPLLRRLFGSTDASAQRSEILLLITGTIVHEKSQVEDMVKKYNDALKTLNDFDKKTGDGPNAKKPFRIFTKEEFF
jgi:type II secretory pathway component GspD/PulD (secretin)